MSSENEQPFFTPMGVMVTIVVLFVGLAIIIPTIYSGPHGTIRMAGAANLRSIVGSYQAYMQNSRTPRIFTAKPGDTVHTVAVTLARETGLNDAILWVIKKGSTDRRSDLLKHVLDGNPPNDVIDPTFAKTSLDYVFVANIPANASPTTTPIAWTRGLRDDGTWAPDSPWEGKGGHIGFLDGHAEWYDKKISLDNNDGNTPLVKYGTTTPTVNIHEALPPGAVILSAEPNPLAKPTP